MTRNTKDLVLRLTQRYGYEPAMTLSSLLQDAACEIERLREYAIRLESVIVRGGNNIKGIDQARDETKVNWEAIHGVQP